MPRSHERDCGLEGRVSQHERTGRRDPTYSRWHRAPSIGRYLDSRLEAESLGMIDLDHIGFIEYENGSRTPLLLVEVAFDNGEFKAATVLTRLGERARLPVICVQYSTGDNPNPFAPDVPDIIGFRVRTCWHWDAFRVNREPVSMSPEQYARWLSRLRDEAIRDRWQKGHIADLSRQLKALRPRDVRLLRAENRRNGVPTI